MVAPPPSPAAAPGATQTTPRPAARRRWATVALGCALPLAGLVGVSALAIGAARTEPDAFAWTVAASAAATLSIVAGAWRTLVALRRAENGPEPAAADVGATKTAAGCEATMRVEIDHKVRNTLQVVASMLSLELRRAGPASAERAGLMRVQARLNCLSLVQRRSSAAVDAPAVMRLDLIAAEIADHLFAEPQPGAATFDTFGVLDPVFGSPDQASAFALFVNEALMGERDRRGGGSVSLALRSVEGGGFLLTVSAHDGATPVGGAADDEPLGARLMANCAAQLHATLTREHVGALREVRLAMHGRLSP